MNQCISTHLVANATGVRNPTGQWTSAITKVVLVYSPVFVLVPSTAGKLGKSANRSQSGSRWCLRLAVKHTEEQNQNIWCCLHHSSSLNLLLQQSKVNLTSKEEAEQPNSLTQKMLSGFQWNLLLEEVALLWIMVIGYKLENQESPWLSTIKLWLDVLHRRDEVQPPSGNCLSAPNIFYGKFQRNAALQPHIHMRELSSGANGEEKDGQMPLFLFCTTH